MLITRSQNNQAHGFARRRAICTRNPTHCTRPRFSSILRHSRTKNAEDSLFVHLHTHAYTLTSPPIIRHRIIANPTRARPQPHPFRSPGITNRRTLRPPPHTPTQSTPSPPASPRSPPPARQSPSSPLQNPSPQTVASPPSSPAPLPPTPPHAFQSTPAATPSSSMLRLIRIRSPTPAKNTPTTPPYPSATSPAAPPCNSPPSPPSSSRRGSIFANASSSRLLILPKTQSPLNRARTLLLHPRRHLRAPPPPASPSHKSAPEHKLPPAPSSPPPDSPPPRTINSRIVFPHHRLPTPKRIHLRKSPSLSPLTPPSTAATPTPKTSPASPAAPLASQKSPHALRAQSAAPSAVP